jgi:hypothetical protein
MSETTNEVQDEQQQDSAPTPADVAEAAQGDTLGEAGKRALDAERAARKETEKRLNEALARVEQFEDSQRTEDEKRQHELETLRAQVADEQKRREAVERDLLVRSVAAEYGIPDELAGRLSGDDREALAEDAKTLQKLIAPSGPRKPSPVPEAGTASTPKGSKGELFENAWRGAFGG